ncbi:hypothetical protein [Pseudoalteromonas luteoviolacea]|uniref:Uncharacterized protein n=1 Tax=Pseudoalteromonas luteoviolacea DSM 6061 TaxID=1365250 RepID=A0A166ULA1_9GAMM|nr:hypothetical protein [Pseudoalteromonas luteoviolacea]KZN30804.1 hypothetical protein N475_24040 [Pseudoalteromonas luteoviolacea DSM 6061]KZN53615.1 hypothetical protein N474_19980 [Pseudoalteromonas luteoviolacea CPMOR-2]MBE0386586.1 hypothetical protein [Pseudoalteromonas luteoviolacea DSM 6061]TQF71440.1 hypothetical protein FLM44_10215 [Pseudoalteromonas luteoviolacea]
MKTVLSIIALLATFSSQAEWIHNTKITDVRWYDINSGHGYITTENSSSPECTSGKASQHRYFSKAENEAQTIISLGLAAMMADKTVDIFLAGCHDGTHSKVKGIIINR